MASPLIGITADNKDNSAASGRYESNLAYSRAVAVAGGVPVLLPHEVELAEKYVELCDGILLTGGADPDMAAFGEATHPKARVMDPRRQAFELALLEALKSAKPQASVLGVCLGMQLMSLHAGGRLDQHLADTMGDAAAVHQKDNRHAVVWRVSESVLIGGKSEKGCRVLGVGCSEEDQGGPDSSAPYTLNPKPNTLDPTLKPDLVTSSHRQAVRNAGTLRIVATAPDGVIEAVDDPSRPFYAGVQWHPERGGDGPLSLGLIERFVAACRGPRG